MSLQGVRTTGIYCRASCRAKPQAQNVRPLRNAVEALALGYRPCLLCRPDRLPDLGLDTSSQPVARALRLIAEGYLDERGSEDLARRVGYSARQLARLFEEHIGASPDLVARAQRAHLARRLLDETDLPVVDVAGAAGFSSLRQMNRVMRSLFGFPPSELRAKRRRDDRLEPLDGGLRLRLPWKGTLDSAGLLGYLASRAIPGVEQVDGGRYQRTIHTCGYPGVLELEAKQESFELTLHLATFGSILEQVQRVRRLVRSEEDLASADRHLGQQPFFEGWLQPGRRLPGAYDPFESAVRILVGQQVSVASASKQAGRLAEVHGVAIPVSLPGQLARLFPGAQRLAAADPAALPMPSARARALVGFSAAVAEGRVELRAGGEFEADLDALQALPGIGPWTAHWIAGRVLGHADAFPAGDLGLRQAAGRRLGRGRALTQGELEDLSQAWRPYRFQAATHLWLTPEPATLSGATDR